MAKKSQATKELTPRQQRRQQQRDAAAARVEPLPVESLAPHPSPPEMLGPSIWVPLFCSCIVLGCLLYHVPGFATPKGNELSWPQPLFTAVNAATLTGFQQARNPNDYTPAGQVLTLFLTIAGMMFSFICGGVAILRIARLKFKDWQLIAWAGGSILLIASLGGIVGSATGSMTPPADTIKVESGMTLSPGLFQAISAFGNSGLIIGRLPVSGSPCTVLFLLPLAVLGGLGLPVLMELVHAVRHRAPLSPHSRAVLSWTAGVYLAIGICLLLLRLPWTNLDGRLLVIDTAEQSINSRSAGFAFHSISSLPVTINFLLVLAMIIGASPGGTGGGIKVTTLSVITTGTRDVLANRAPGRRFGAALVWLASYLGLLVIATIALLMTNPELPLDRTLFLAASALGNLGLSHNPIDPSSGMYVLSAAMLVGRVAPVLMLWYLIDTTPDAVVAMG